MSFVDIIGNIFMLLGVAFFVSIPFIWIWVFYHKIKCRKAENCANRKCKYWGWCKHNEVERRKDEFELRKQALAYNLGISVEDLEKKDN